MRTKFWWSLYMTMGTFQTHTAMVSAATPATSRMPLTIDPLNADAKAPFGCVFFSFIEESTTAAIHPTSVSAPVHTKVAKGICTSGVHHEVPCFAPEVDEVHEPSHARNPLTGISLRRSRYHSITGQKRLRGCLRPCGLLQDVLLHPLHCLRLVRLLKMHVSENSGKTRENSGTDGKFTNENFTRGFDDGRTGTPELNLNITSFSIFLLEFELWDACLE